jgi:hypothetical protein
MNDTFQTPSADAIRAMVKCHNYNGARVGVLLAADQGRATYLPAGARDNATARVLVDGTEVGQASSLMHYVREELTGTMFGERKLLVGYKHDLPEGLRHLA